MTENYKSTNADIVAHTASIVAGYASHNKVDDLPALIRQVYDALLALSGGEAPAKSNGQKPAVPVAKSVTPDYIVCLEDGKKMKMLKRYLKTAYNMTPGQYREKWGLPADYPMVAPNYAAKRSHLARESGLGTSRSEK